MSNQQSKNSSDSINTATQPEVANGSSTFDVVLWIIAIVLLLAASLVGQYLPQYWVPANNIWVRVAITIACILVALGLLYATHQGKGFFRLLKDSRIELKRVIWPTKQETVNTTWQVSVVVIVTALVLWGFDTLFSRLIQLIIG
ncbi:MULTISPECIES: preprotein translocase subunit SecE [unclassified Acinetobacter]|uniref:preprotein translocase subunit SecE n=1 Tax=unclassified Acinetobacter TaxID=196816 RepID=UPI0035B83A2F